MVGAFRRITSLVERGIIRVVEISGIPRSLSTAMGRCLNESSDASIFVNEPSHANDENDIDIPAGHVVGFVEQALPSAVGQLTVVSKNMANNLAPQVFRAWTDVCVGVVWCIRDPRVQIASVATRTANDLLFGYGSAQLEQSDLQHFHMSIVDEFLRNSFISTDYSKLGWRAIAAQFASCPSDQRSLVADASLFGRFPDRMLRYLCDGLGLLYRDRMVEHWSRPILNVNSMYSRIDDLSDAWVSDAVSAQGIRISTRAPLDAALLPLAMRRHLTKVAMPTYDMLMRAFFADNNIARYGLDECWS